eukprot:15481095-Alexandrium_andersonii.AAC.1
MGRTEGALREHGGPRAKAMLVRTGASELWRRARRPPGLPGAGRTRGAARHGWPCAEAPRKGVVRGPGAKTARKCRWRPTARRGGTRMLTQ